MRGVIACFTMAAGVTSAAAEVYPTQEAARPLLLPVGALEASADLRIGIVDFDSSSMKTYEAAPRVRYGLDRFEVEAGAVALLAEDVPDGIFPAQSDTLRRIDIAGRFAIADESAAGVSLAMSSPSSDYAAYELGAHLAHKRHFGDASALALSLGPSYTVADSNYDMLRVESRVAAIAQPSSTVAVDAHADLGLYDVTSTPDPLFPDPGWSFYQSYGVGTVVSLTDLVDLTAAFDVQASGQYAAKSVMLGVTARRLP